MCKIDLLLTVVQVFPKHNKKKILHHPFLRANSIEKSQNKLSPCDCRTYSYQKLFPKKTLILISILGD